MRGNRGTLDKRDGLVERFCEFIRLNYVTGAEVARRIGFRKKAVYSWLSGHSRPRKPELITAFPESLPAEKSAIE